jgi:fluoroacetyl-CoA thioesterase
MSELQPGLTLERTREVTRNESAQKLGSGTLEVFATPAMALMIEQACLEMVEGYLEQDQTTVGIHLELNHLAPTPLGDVVRIKAELVKMEKHVFYFEAKVWDSTELIGEASHQRALIDTERFLRRVAKKKSDLDLSSSFAG